MWIFSCWDKSWPFQLQKLRFWIKSAFSGEFLVVEEEKTYCSDQEALCMEALHWNKRFEKQNASKIYFKRLPIAQLIDAVYKRLQRWYLSSAPENVRQLWSDLFIFSEGLNGWAMIRICKTVHWSHHSLLPHIFSSLLMEPQPQEACVVGLSRSLPLETSSSCKMWLIVLLKGSNLIYT